MTDAADRLRNSQAQQSASALHLYVHWGAVASYGPAARLYVWHSSWKEALTVGKMQQANLPEGAGDLLDRLQSEAGRIGCVHAVLMCLCSSFGGRACAATTGVVLTTTCLHHAAPGRWRAPEGGQAAGEAHTAAGSPRAGHSHTGGHPAKGAACVTRQQSVALTHCSSCTPQSCCLTFGMLWRPWMLC